MGPKRANVTRARRGRRGWAGRKERARRAEGKDGLVEGTTAVRLRKGWMKKNKSRCRALRGNTMEPFLVMAWNMRKMDLEPKSATARRKQEFLGQRLETLRPAVVGLMEMQGSRDEFAAWRRWARKLQYECVVLVGEGKGGGGGADESHANGIVVMVAKEQAAVRRFVRVAERVLCVQVNCKVDRSERHFAFMHGLHSAGFNKQLRDATTHMRGAEVAGGLLAADFNRVLCPCWRASGRASGGARGDTLLRAEGGWACQRCSRQVAVRGVQRWVGGAGEEFSDDGKSVSWTHFEQCGGKLTPRGHRIDGAMAYGREVGRWRLVDQIVPVAEETADAVSDHVAMVYSIQLRPAVRRETRSKTMARGGSKIGVATKAALAAREAVAERMRVAARGAREAGTSEAEAAQGAVRREAAAAEATARAEAVRAQSERRASARAIYNDWKARLAVIERMAATGVDPRSLHGHGLMQEKAGLWRRVEGSKSSVMELWQRLRRLARRQMRRAGWRACQKEREETRAIVMAARERPDDDAQRRFERTFGATKKQQPTVAMEYMHEGDDPAREQVHTSTERYEQLSAEIGTSAVEKLDFGSVVAAAKAWLEIFTEEQEELRGVDGERFDLQRELTFDLFVRTLYAMPTGKAVGQSGFAVEMLTAFARHGPEQRAMFDAIMADLKAAAVPPSWRVVVYALLVKPPPNNPNVVCERREIAIMEQMMKLTLQMTRSVSYSRASGRIHRAQQGWLKGMMTADVGLLLDVIIQQQARLGVGELWILFIDLKCFFPSMPRHILRLVEEAHGVPREVLDLAAAIYCGKEKEGTGGAACRYDSAAGLGGFFENWMGSMMGCVLSTDKAKLFINCVITAIAMIVQGVELWGAQPATLGDVWESITQGAFADDWFGAFKSKEQAVKAWRIWRAFCKIFGSKLGVKERLKTGITGVRYEEGKAVEVADPGLELDNGATVPFWSHLEAYKHLGIWKRADGANAHTWADVKKKLLHLVRRLGRLRFATRAEFCMVADVLLLGMTNFGAQSTFVSFEQAEEVEAKFRQAYYRRFGISSSTPRLQVYARTGKTEKGKRTHIWAGALASLYTTVTTAMADKAATPQRTAIRSCVALAMAAWGCTGDPCEWRFEHIESELEAFLRRSPVKYLGDAFLLACIKLGRAGSEEEEEAEVRDPEVEASVATAGTARLVRLEGMRSDDPLRAGAPHFACPISALLFEPRAAGGLGIAPAQELLAAGIKAVGHLRAAVPVAAATGATSGQPDPWNWITSFDELRAAHPSLRDTPRARAAWRAVMAEVVGAGGPNPERGEDLLGGWRVTPAAPLTARQQQHARAAYGKLVVELDKATLKSKESADVRVTAGEVARWRRLIEEGLAVPSDAVPVTCMWDTGAASTDAIADGPRLVFDYGSTLDVMGGQRRWLAAVDTGPDGWRRGWEERADWALKQVSVDADGYVRDAWSGLRLDVMEAAALGPGVEMAVRAREQMDVAAEGAEVPVTEGAAEKRRQTHVNRGVAGESLQKMVVWGERIGVEAWYTLDGARGEITQTNEKGDEYKVCVAGRAAARQDGTVVGGSMAAGAKDNYLAEFGAQIDAAVDAPVRVLGVIMDATSPTRALRKFIGLHDRHKRKKLRARWLDSWWQALQRFDAVVFLWQTSHVGAPNNEWADILADLAMRAEEQQVWLSPSCTYASMEIAGAPRGPRSWALPRARRTVNARLAETTSGTQFITEDDLELPRLPKGLDGIAEAVLSARVQVGDPRRYRGRLSGERVRQLGCPFGCTDGAGGSVLFSWAHVQFACTGQCVQVARRVWQRDVHAAAAYLMDSGCGRFAGAAGVNAAAGADARKKGWMSTQWVELRAQIDAACSGRERTSWGPVVAKPGSAADGRMRRAVGGCVKGSGDKHMDGNQLMLQAVAAAVKSGLRVQEEGKRATEVWERELREELARMAKVKDAARRWRLQVVRGGPWRARGLREAAEALEMAEVLRRRRHASGAWSTAQRAESKAAAMAAAAEMRHIARARRPASEGAALAQWKWLAMLRTWRLRVARASRSAVDGEWRVRQYPLRWQVHTPAAHLRVLAAALEAEQVAARTRAAGVRPAPCPRLRPRVMEVAREAGGEGGVTEGLAARAAAARRAFQCGGGRRRREALKGEEVQAGRRGDKRGRWALEELLEVRRVRGRGRGLEVHVRWSGGDATGRPWEDSWVGVTWLTHDLPTIYKAKPERWEAELYKTDASEGQPGQGLQQAGLQAPCTAQRDRATGTARGLSKRGRRGGA